MCFEFLCYICGRAVLSFKNLWGILTLNMEYIIQRLFLDENKEGRFKICLHCDRTDPSQVPVRDKTDQKNKKIRKKIELN